MTSVKKVKIVITTTPRANKITHIKEWITWAENHFTNLPECCEITKFIAAMPTRPDKAIADKLDELLGSSNKDWAAMEPGLIGAGDTFRGACFFGFEDDPPTDTNNPPTDYYVFHSSIDIDYGNPHNDDVQYNAKKMLDTIDVQNDKNKILDTVKDSSDKPRPKIVIGDYVPKIWDEKTKSAKANPFKAMLEEHVKEQLRHYFPDNIVDRLGITRPRSEMFLIHRSLFEQVVAERRFWPWDPLPLILIYAERKGFDIDHVFLGNFYEKPKFASASIRDQVWRTAIQISSEWLRWEHKSTLKAHEIRALLPIWQETISDGMTLAFKALERMLRHHRII